jgi:hypothetical protein
MSAVYGNNQAAVFTDSYHNATTASDARQAQVPASFDVLEKSIEALAMNCSEMEKRLEPVLRHEPEATENRPKEAQATVVGVAQRVNDTSARVHILNNQLNSILRRLEL